ncbi:LemA family protein [Streptococcus suis]|uniref:LemA family protein n=1 Tax=Streptococcus suis TaxID=1307 RepID=UPI001ABE0DD8|nr:LemA family protein [Streptococcus suis]
MKKTYLFFVTGLIVLGIVGFLSWSHMEVSEVKSQLQDAKIELIAPIERQYHLLPSLIATAESLKIRPELIREVKECQEVFENAAPKYSASYWQASADLSQSLVSLAQAVDQEAATVMEVKAMELADDITESATSLEAAAHNYNQRLQTFQEFKSQFPTNLLTPLSSMEEEAYYPQ